jgi:hypothetical protein
MFGFRSNNTTIRPPAVVTTLGQLKQQYEDPDWSHPPQLQQQHAESRGDQYAYDRGGIDDIRDMPLSPQQQQFMLSREGASYMAAIKAVDESMYSDGRGGTTVLRGLWKVFDSVVSELGTELTATLANKAIVEGKRVVCVYPVVCCHKQSSLNSCYVIIYCFIFNSECDARELATSREEDYQSREESRCTEA